MSTSPDIRAILWVAVNPMIQLMLVGGIGNLLARYGILTTQGSKMLSKIYIQALAPSLLFSKMVDSVTPQAVKRMVIVAPFVLIYMGLGCLAGVFCRWMFSKRLPTTFNYSLLVASIWSNWGDIPLAVINNFTSSPPFKKGDGDLGVAYIAVFMVIFNVTLFPLGGHKLVARDFKNSLNEKNIKDEKSIIEPQDEPGYELSNFNSDNLPVPTTPKLPFYQKHFNILLKFFISFLTPANIGIILGLIVGLSPAKDLFVKGENNPFLVKGLSPPLFIIYDTTKFLGAACVPVGLLNIGASLVNLNFKALPLSLNFTLAFFKLILMPLVGISVVYWCSHGLNLIDPEEKVLQLVLMLGTCVPTATTSLILTQFYSPNGEAQHIASLLIVQYLLGFFTMTTALAIATYMLS